MRYSATPNDFRRWHSGESACLPPMWPRFDSRTRRHMWVDRDCCWFSSLSREFYSGFSGLPRSTSEKATLLNTNFFGCNVDVVSSYNQAKIEHTERSLLGVICIYFIFVGQRHLGWVARVPPRGKEVPENLDTDADILQANVVAFVLFHTIDIHHRQ